MRILLVEDEPHAALLLAKGLREQTFAVDVATDGRQAAERAFVYKYDAIILDLMLPLRDGLSVVREIRARGELTPILVVTAVDAIESRIQGLDSGADDYLTKPFDFGELLARLRAIVRRGTRPIAPERLTAAGVVINTRSREVRRGERILQLTAREYALLEFLARRAGEVITRTEIAAHVWDEHYEPFSNVIDVYVQRLRRKLEAPGEPPVILTRRGEGYILGAAASVIENSSKAH
jgi:two-component system, OmpR family, copper resistance phosphate regulon response regulator CusR